ncbi:2,3-bisphosphoglycerate-independent phosphoglycerate mutase [Patescibacteria group bacterium]
MYKPVILVVLDGWGLSNEDTGNAIKTANTPTTDKLSAYYPELALQASGVSVGIPWGDPGNSEVGHLTLGAGKIIYQNLPRINLSIEDGSFFNNEVLLEGIKNVKDKKSNLHLMGLLGEGAVHSYHEHLFALLELASKNKVKNVFLHLFMDGRDSPPQSGINMIKKLQEKMNEFKVGKIATVCGRNWAMDRNNNWDRIQKSYDALTLGKGEKIEDPIKYLQASYQKDITDEYIEPGVVMKKGEPLVTINDNDTVVFFNFREDRARQITTALSESKFKKFKKIPLDIQMITFTEYEKFLPVSVVFPPEEIVNGLGETLGKSNKKQVRIAETEKYAHVTYFFNGGAEDPWPGEDRILVPSPSVSKFDETPSMSAREITEKAINAINSDQYDFILVNYANPDMVGHTGNIEPTKKAIEFVDQKLGELITATLKKDGCVLITADHGNAEELICPNSGDKVTEHSSNPVPLWLVTPNNHKSEPRSKDEILLDENQISGLLSDVAPTVLEIMGIPEPKEMNGESLLPQLQAMQ